MVKSLAMIFKAGLDKATREYEAILADDTRERVLRLEEDARQYVWRLVEARLVGFVTRRFGKSSVA